MQITEAELNGWLREQHEEFDAGTLTPWKIERLNTVTPGWNDRSERARVGSRRVLLMVVPE
jgi:hypothetical protein